MDAYVGDARHLFRRYEVSHSAVIDVNTLSVD